MENNLNNKMQIITTLVSFPSRLNPEAKMAQWFARRALIKTESQDQTNYNNLSKVWYRPT